MIVSPLLGAERQELLLCMCNFRRSVWCRYLKTGFSVSCAVFCQLVAMEKSGWKLCPPVSAFLDLPAASCSFSRWRGHRAHWGQVLSLQALELLRLSSLGDRRLLSCCIDSQLYLKRLDVLGTLLCSVSTKRTAPGPQHFQAGLCQRVPSPIPFLFLHFALTSDLKGLGLFPLQPLSLLIWNLHAWTSLSLSPAPNTGPRGQRGRSPRTPL